MRRSKPAPERYAVFLVLKPTDTHVRPPGGYLLFAPSRAHAPWPAADRQEHGHDRYQPSPPSPPFSHEPPAVMLLRPRFGVSPTNVPGLPDPFFTAPGEPSSRPAGANSSASARSPNWSPRVHGDPPAGPSEQPGRPGRRIHLTATSAARIMATMPARTALDSLGHAATPRAKPASTIRVLAAPVAAPVGLGAAPQSPDSRNSLSGQTLDLGDTTPPASIRSFPWSRVAAAHRRRWWGSIRGATGAQAQSTA
jgi:hypothetical protein